MTDDIPPGLLYLEESSVPEPALATFDPVERKIEFQATDSTYIGKRFVCYLNAHLGVSVYQPPVQYYLEPWQFEVAIYVYKPPNKPPYI